MWPVSPLPLCVSYGLSPKFHQPRLLRVKRQSIAGKPLGQYVLHLFRVLSVLEAQYGVIGKTDLVRFTP